MPIKTSLVGGTLMVWPPTIWQGSNPGESNVICDEPAEIYSGVFLAVEDFVIDKVHFKNRSVTTSGDLDVRIEKMSLTDGFPSGTLWATNTNITFSIVDTQDDIWLRTASLTAPATILRGERFAVSFVCDATANLTFPGWAVHDDSTAHIHHYTGSWAHIGARAPAILLENAAGDYMHCPGTGAYSGGGGSNTLTTGSTPDEYGVKFQLPFPALVVGCVIWKGTATAGGTFDFVLYEGTTARLTHSIDNDEFINMEAQSGASVAASIFTTTYPIAANTDYRMVIKGTHASNGMKVRYGTLAAGANTNAVKARRAAWCGTNWIGTERDGGGAWDADRTDEAPFMQIIFGGFDDGTSGERRSHIDMSGSAVSGRPGPGGVILPRGSNSNLRR